jgi:hypothetical protein
VARIAAKVRVHNRGPQEQVIVRGVDIRGPQEQVIVRGVDIRGPHEQVFVRGVDIREMLTPAGDPTRRFANSVCLVIARSPTQSR